MNAGQNSRIPALSRNSGVPELANYSAKYTLEPDFVSLLEYWRILWRRRAFIACLAVAGLTMGILYSRGEEEMYRARAAIEVQDVNENFVYAREFDPHGGAVGGQSEANVATQARILRSESLIRRTADKVGLTKHASVTKESRTRQQLRGILGWIPGMSVTQHTPGMNDGSRLAYELASKRLKVQVAAQLDSRTRVIEISFEWPDAALAAAFINALIDDYMQGSLYARWETAKRTSEWLTRQLDDMKTKLADSEARLQTYTRVSGLMYTGDQEKHNVAEAKLADVQARLSAASADRIMTQSQYELIRSSSPESLPKALENSTLQQYQSKLSALRQEAAELSASMTPAHMKVRRVQAQIAELEEDIKREQVFVRERIENEYNAAQRREELLSSAYTEQSEVVREQGGKAVQYNLLRREVEASRNLYESLMQKARESGIALALRASHIRIVDPAVPPEGTINGLLPVLSSGAGLLLGSVLGITIVLFREWANQNIHKPGDAPRYLNVPELGIIPSAEVDYDRLHFSRKKLQTLMAGTGVESSPLELVTFNRKPSLVAESFRNASASILFGCSDTVRPRIIVVTSAREKEGKTTVVTNLAITLAEIGKRVLLIDGDLRRPRLSRIFRLSNEWGFIDMLKEPEFTAQELARKVQPTDIPRLYVLPSGSASVSELYSIYSTRLAGVLKSLANEFDAVLIDSPPLLQISDTRMFAAASDGVIMVIRANWTDRDHILAAHQQLAQDGSVVLGTILNRWDPKRTGTESYARYYREYQSAGPRSNRNS